MKRKSSLYLALIFCFSWVGVQGSKPASARPSSEVRANGSPHVVGDTVKPRTETPLLPLPSKSKTNRHSSKQSSSNTTSLTQLPGQSSTWMPDGRVLLLGGEGNTGPVATAFLRDPRTGAITQIANGLQHARAWHTATMLPNGLVLVFGGVGLTGDIERAAELFDPVSGKFQVVDVGGLTPRSSHTATLLTNGMVLFAGGLEEHGETAGALEFWDFRTAQNAKLNAIMVRSNHTATLLGDGTVLFWGGVNASGVGLDYGEIFDPDTQTLRIQASAITLQNPAGPPQLAESIPQDGTNGVAVDAFLAIRFSEPLNVVTVVTGVTLTGPQGVVDAKIVPAEAGMLAFVSPSHPLDPGTSYTLSLSGLADNSGQLLPDQNIVFTTTPPQGGNSGSGTGTSGSGIGVVLNGGGGSSDPLKSPFRNLPPLQAKPGVTALAGQVLRLDGTPLSKVTLEVDGESTSVETDGTGRFLLQPLTAAHHTIWIDGGTASSKDATYGLFEVGIDIIGGQTNVLNYTIWMTPLDMAHAVTIASPTQSEVVVTTPTLPGLELHLPPQSTILDRNGKVVTQISITSIPVNQPPFPLPKDVLVPLYFTIQPGGAYIQVANTSEPQGGRLYYPNTYKYAAGSVYNFYNYDADNKGWYVYGQGTVSADRSQVVPNPGTFIYEFTGAMVSNPGKKPPKGPDCKTKPCPGDPVDLQTGLFVYSKTDLVIADVIPLVLTRTYRPADFVPHAFGIGTNHPYDIFMVGDNNGGAFPEGYTYQDLVLPDGGSIHFTRTSTCTGTNGYCDYGNAVYTATSTPTDFYGATIRWGATAPGAAWTLTKKDGTVYQFPDSDNATIPQAAAPVAMNDRFGNALTFTRDANHNLTQITSPNGRYISFTYDSSNRITQAKDNIGRKVQYTYDSNGRLSTVTDANNGVWTYTYDANNNMLTIQDPRQIVYLQSYYDANNRVYKQIDADNGTYLFSYTLDQNGNVTQTNVTDPNGNVERVAFNADGYMSSDTFALGKPEQETFTYSRQPGSGLLQSVTDSLARTTSYTYDTMGNVTSVTRLAGTSNAVTTQFAYDPTFNQLTSVTDPLGHTTSFSRDTSGNPVAIVDPLGNTTAITYNSAGQPLSVTDPLGNTNQFTYNAGDLVGITDPLSRAVTRFVDDAGRLVSTTDPLGNKTESVYNPFNQVTSTTDAKGNVTSFAYDPNGNLLSVTDANNHQTQYTYDSMDRVATRKDALLNQESYQYDGNGNLTQFTDRRGKVTTFTYDGLNRRTFAGYGTTAGPAYENTVTYTYDSGNRLTQVADSIAGTITRGYDGLDRLTSDATPQGTVTYTYDAAGRRASLTVPGQSVVNYTFDVANRLTQIGQGSAAVQFAYDSANRRTTLTLPNGAVTSYSYDSASQLAGLNYSAGASTIGNLTYSYDLASRRANLGGSLATVNLPTALSSATYNANNQLTAWGGTTLSYDLNGNLTNDGAHGYSWDARNHLTQMDGGVTASFVYDALGRRTTKTILGGQTGFLYDGANPVQELSGTTVTANLLTGGLDEYFSRTDASGTRHFLTDALGSTLELTDSSGAVQTNYVYEPFGSTTATGASTTNSFAYTGREMDGTGLYFYRTRYYDPALLRFMSEDLIGFGGGINLYQYVLSNPLNKKDPHGTYGGADDLIAAGAGAALGLTGQVISDVLSGQVSSLGSYAGATFGGAIAGETLLYTGNPYLAGGAGAFLGNALKQDINGLTNPGAEFDGPGLARDTAIGVGTGLIPDAATSLRGLARQLVKGLPGTVAGAEADAATRLAEMLFKGLSGRKP